MPAGSPAERRRGFTGRGRYLPALVGVAAPILTACEAPSTTTYAPRDELSAPTTIREDEIYDSPSTELTRVRDSSGRALRYERRSR